MDHIFLNTCVWLRKSCLTMTDSVPTSVQNKDLEFKHSPELHLDSRPTLHILFHAHRLVIEAKNLLRDNFQHKPLKGCPQGCLREPGRVSEQDNFTACPAVYSISSIPTSNWDTSVIYAVRSSIGWGKGNMACSTRWWGIDRKSWSFMMTST